MIELGIHNTLTILRDTRVGLFLGDEEGNEILLPGKYRPEHYETGDSLTVFCYLDNEQRPVATTLEPLIERNRYAPLEVAEVNQYGAFLEWGLEKHLLVPFREQTVPMKKGETHVVYCYLDPKSSRLVASARLNRFLDNRELEVRPGQQVALLVTRETELGFEVVVENRHKGLLFKDRVFRDLKRGDRLQGYVQKIRPDQKLDITLEPIGYRQLEPAASRIYKAMQQAGGMLPLHDKSSPEAIKERLQMSKKMFKKGVGILYRERKIDLRPDGIYLLPPEPGA
ncbi:MAG: S1-like domain-containing RNA-binding protein [Robiginitalea sp.]